MEVAQFTYAHVSSCTRCMAFELSPDNKLDGPSPLLFRTFGMHVLQQKLYISICLTRELFFTLPKSIFNRVWFLKFKFHVHI